MNGSENIMPPETTCVLAKLDMQRAHAFAREILKRAVSNDFFADDERDVAAGIQTFSGLLVDRLANLTSQLGTLLDGQCVTDFYSVIEELLFEFTLLCAPFTLGVSSTVELSLAYLYCRAVGFPFAPGMLNTAQFCSKRNEDLVAFDLMRNICMAFEKAPSDIFYRLALQALLLDSCVHTDHAAKCFVCQIHVDKSPIERKLQMFALYRERVQLRWVKQNMRHHQHHVDSCMFLLMLQRKFPREVLSARPIFTQCLLDAADESISLFSLFTFIEQALFEVRFAQTIDLRHAAFVRAKTELTKMIGVSFDDLSKVSCFSGLILTRTPAVMLTRIFNMVNFDSEYPRASPDGKQALNVFDIPPCNKEDPLDLYVWYIAKGEQYLIDWRNLRRALLNTLQSDTFEGEEPKHIRKAYEKAILMFNNAESVLKKLSSQEQNSIIGPQPRIIGATLERRLNSGLKHPEKLGEQGVKQLADLMSSMTVQPPWMSPVMGAGLDLFQVAHWLAMLCGHIVVELGKRSLMGVFREVDVPLQKIITICKKMLASLNYHQPGDTLCALIDSA